MWEYYLVYQDPPDNSSSTCLLQLRVAPHQVPVLVIVITVVTEITDRVLNFYCQLVTSIPPPSPPNNPTVFRSKISSRIEIKMENIKSKNTQEFSQS